MNNSTPRTGSEKKPFAFTAAHLGVGLLLTGSIITVAFSVFKGAVANDDAPLPWQYTLGFTLLAVACYLIGMVFSIVALCGIPRHGRAGLLSKGLAGMLLNGVLLLFTGIYIIVLQPTIELAKAHKQFNDAADRLRQSSRDSLNPTNGFQPGITPLEKFIATSTEASKNLKGADAVAMQAGLAYFAKLKVENDAYTQAATALQDGEMLNGDTLKTKDQLAPRRKIVQSFLDTNRRFREFVRDSEQHFETELKARSLIPEDIGKAMAAFHKGDNRNILVLKIRDSDERIGKSILGTLDLLEKQWGQWKFDGKTDLFTFQDTEAAKQYATLQKDLVAASEEQAALQQQLLGPK